MLDNYTKTVDGVIKQISFTPYVYDEAYTEDRYINQPTSDIMSYLRLGFIVGSIGHVPKSLMDVGYGSGNFLQTCKGFINELYGNDVPPAYKLPEDIQFVNNITQQHVEVVTFFDSLEHFPDIEFVKDLNCRFVVISLPWCYNGNDDEWFKSWKHRREDEHLYHFDKDSLTTFMDRQGYTLLNYSNIEDKIRVDKNLTPNILTACFEKR